MTDASAIDMDPSGQSLEGASTYKVGGRTLVLGLSWRALRSKDSAMRRDELREQAVTLQAMFGVLLESSSDRVMVGFLPRGSKVKPAHSVSGAGWLSCSVTSQTFVVKQLGPDRYWLAMVRPAEINPHGDVVGPGALIGGLLDTAIDDAQRDTTSDFPELLLDVDEAPPSRTVDGAMANITHASLKTLLAPKMDRRSRFTRLRGVPPTMIFVVIGVLVAVVAAYGLYAWRQNVAKHEALEAAQRDSLLRKQQARKIASLREARILKAVGDALAKDTATGRPSAFGRWCVDNYQLIGGDPAGWRLMGVSCSAGGSLSASFERPNKSIGDNATLASWADSLGHGASLAFTPDSRKASMGFQGGVLKRRSGLTIPMLPAQAMASRRIGTWLQRYAIAWPTASVTIRAAKDKALTYIDPEKRNANRQTPVPSNRTYAIGTVQISGGNLQALADLVIDFPWVAVKSAQIKPRGVGDGQVDWVWEASYVTAN